MSNVTLCIYNVSKKIHRTCTICPHIVHFLLKSNTNKVDLGSYPSHPKKFTERVQYAIPFLLKNNTNKVDLGCDLRDFCVKCYRMAKTHRIPYLYRSFSAKVTPIFSGSFVENDLQLGGSYESLPPCTLCMCNVSNTGWR